MKHCAFLSLLFISNISFADTYVCTSESAVGIEDFKPKIYMGSQTRLVSLDSMTVKSFSAVKLAHAIFQCRKRRYDL